MDRVERHDFWSQFLLFILPLFYPFFRREEKRGSEKPKSWSKVMPFGSIILMMNFIGINKRCFFSHSLYSSCSNWGTFLGIQKFFKNQFYFLVFTFFSAPLCSSVEKRGKNSLLYICSPKNNPTFIIYKLLSVWPQ